MLAFVLAVAFFEIKQASGSTVNTREAIEISIPNDMLTETGNRSYVTAATIITLPEKPKPVVVIPRPTVLKIRLPEDINPRTWGQCVIWARYATGINIRGNAITWRYYINSQTPEIGSVVVIKIGRLGHIGKVVGKDLENNKVWIQSRNWRGLWIVSTDVFAADDVRILGYINKNVFLASI
mgnify:CR=1 FL=1